MGEIEQFSLLLAGYQAALSYFSLSIGLDTELSLLSKPLWSDGRRI